jgi:outer membrane protein OmpA-like peptidoglycan-associated protein/tetratricopeptide (TPR) repeat protein
MENQHSNTQVFKYSINRLLFLLFLPLLLSCAATKAQSNYTSSNKKAIKLFEEAQQYYQQYKLVEAKNTLKEALERDNTFLEAITLLAYVNLDQGNYTEAKTNFSKAVNINPRAIPNNLFFLAELELNEGEYSVAQTHFNQFLSAGQIDPRLADKTNNRLSSIEFAITAKANPVPFTPKNLGPAVNSEFSEYFPCITVDEETLLFTRRLKNPDSPQGFNEDFFVAQKSEGEWQQASNIGQPINTIVNEGAPSLSADGQILIFTACELYGDYGANRKGSGSCDLFYAAKNGNNWTNPINLGKAINSNHWETQPSYASDGKTLYFVRGIRDRSGSRTGDIYVSRLDEENYWGKPEKLNAHINTEGNEESVFIHPDGQTLYFASDGHTGMGGLDIFVSRKDSTGEWGPAVNLGYPINTHKNENSLLVAANGEIAYFASDRAEGYGELDLYSFELPKQFAPKKVTYFAGKIFDKESLKPLAAKFELIDLMSGDVTVESFSNESDGAFLVSLPTGRDYALNASKDGYLFYSENFSLRNKDSDEPYKQDVPLEPIQVGKKIVLKNIFFETAKYNLKESSKIELNKLSNFLQRNSNLKVEISGHTDNIGSAQSNQELSKNRAQSVYQYLIDAGIDSSRLQAVGYGASKPIADNESEEGRAKNRRTEFKIVAL